MMRTLRGAVPILLALAGPGGARVVSGAASADPLSVEIERWEDRLAAEPSSDPLWMEVKAAAGPGLADARRALRDGRRSLALLRLAAARESLAAAAWMLGQPEATRKDEAAFEAEWARAGERLRDARGPLSPEALAGAEPALARALGEAALHQVRVYYDASLEYGRSTSPESGLFYLGAAQAQLDFVSFARTLRGPSGSAARGEAAPRLRSLAPELEALEGELLAAYRPPASIDKHREFISASATLKTARELDAAGLRYGALLRYLQAAQRVAALRAAAAPSGSASLPGGIAVPGGSGDRGRLYPEPDDSLRRAFLELAEAESAEGSESARATAATVADEILPRYQAALRDAAPRPPRPEPRATVTLVRWPYT